ncbi:MAG: hypothetical protein JRG91_12600 [Deltaproteobacteria bacterium]|nr:hypothetical protein [Deltaproteobacteria bacterium]
MNAMKVIGSAAIYLILLGCTGPATSAPEALETARAHLSTLNVPHEDRSSTVSLDGDVYTVVLHLPEGWLGGDFIVRVSAEDGSVLGTELWR